MSGFGGVLALQGECLSTALTSLSASNLLPIQILHYIEGYHGFKSLHTYMQYSPKPPSVHHHWVLLQCAEHQSALQRIAAQLSSFEAEIWS